jgi:TM2 domain-containing membrane protein YozV
MQKDRLDFDKQINCDTVSFWIQNIVTDISSLLQKLFVIDQDISMFFGGVYDCNSDCC